MRKAKAQIENGKTKDSRQSLNQEKRSYKRSESDLRERGPNESWRNFYFPQSRYDEYTPLNAKKGDYIQRGI